ncbi:hypothetical protein B0H67DRAFT_484140 [Lasiosphaeris hirsuta]|uniref:COP9 signalosome complex subunit 3 N-terminal helical repeats domain-containing protein n=1 Tax=Lasiosphaeris hirsuta TaxID=260670 RepID=A0AA40ARB8_9PEZI|nr:hypothetical protein B0H67DRAFT_484140 [Lasiosphaeris hirsuta]
MDHCASVLLAFPEAKEITENYVYHKTAQQHVQKVERLIKENTATFSGLAAQLLEHVNPAINSISYLALLQTLLSRDKAPQTNQPLLSAITTFLMTFDPRQIRYVGTTLSNLLTTVGEGEIFPASVAVDLLATALLRIDPTGSMLTSHHISLVNLAYLTDNIEPIRPVIEKTIVFYPGIKSSSDGRYLCDMQLPPPAYITPDTGLTTKLNSSAVLQYDLLCGLCFIARSSWQKAFDALERVISYPTKDGVCSNIMAKAHNKWVLVGLLLTGKTPTVPALAWQGAQKIYGTLGKPYTSIGTAFEQETAETLKAEFETLGQQFWAEEGNLGLMRLVLAHYQRWKIVGLRDIYTKISLAQIRTITQSAETGTPLATEAEVLELVLGMIQDGMLNGVVEQPEGQPAYLTFLSPTEELSEAEFGAKMLQTAQRIKNLEPIVKATNERLGTSREYLRHLVRDSKNKDKDPGFVGFDHSIEDEDLMSGVLGP